LAAVFGDGVAVDGAAEGLNDGGEGDQVDDDAADEVGEPASG
jgi:hypothetical protein